MGKPARAVVSLAVPTMVASSLHSVYNLADLFWVAGLGGDALAAVGFCFPFVFVGLTLSRCLGIGGGSAVSRFIGAGDMVGANTAASIVMQLSVIVGVLASLLLVLFAPFFLARMGAAGEVLRLASLYARISFSGTLFLIFSQTAIAILRSAGEAKGAMKVMLLGSLINIVVDPVFIYGFKLGVAGAALASLLADFVIVAIITRQVLMRGQAFVKIHLNGVPWRRDVVADVFRVGIPSMAAMGGTMVMSFCVTIIAAFAGGAETVAIYIVGRRIINLATMPMQGFASAATAVCGAWYGADNYPNFREAYFAAVGMAFGVQVVLSGLIFIFALYIARLFTWGESDPALVLGLIVYLRIVPWMNPATSIGWITAAMFQGVGMGVTAMIMNITRTAVLSVLSIWFMVVILELGRLGLWWGFVVGAVIYLPMAVSFGTWFLSKNRHGFVNNRYALKKDHSMQPN